MSNLIRIAVGMGVLIFASQPCQESCQLTIAGVDGCQNPRKDSR
jgi:hypothetical protein